MKDNIIMVVYDLRQTGSELKLKLQKDCSFETAKKYL